MNYLGKVTKETVKELCDKLGTSWDPCYSIYPKCNTEYQFIKLQGFYMREDLFDKYHSHPMTPSFWNIDQSDIKEGDNVVILPDFSTTEEWVKLYKNEYSKYSNR